MLIRLTFAALMVCSMIYVAVAQSPRPPESADAIVALVTELRAIRSELTDASQRTLRFQLLLARLQLQEQRIGHLDRQRAEVSKSLMDAQTMSTMFSTQFDQMARSCEDGIPPEERKACESQIATMKATAASHAAREQQLRLQEQDLSQAIATEQGRWADFSSRLDELERALSRPR